MTANWKALAVGLLIVALAHGAEARAADSVARHVLEEIKVGGPDGWDYATFDPTTKNLYIAHGSAIASVNVVTKIATPHLADAQGAHIALPFAAGSRLLITHGKADQVTLNDAKTGGVEAAIPVDAKPDAALIEPKYGRAFVMANSAGMVDVIDLTARSVIARIPVGGAPESGTVDGQGLVFTHLEDRNSIVVIDARTLKVRATYPMNDCEEPTGLAAIPRSGYLLSACANQTARITNAATGTEVASLPIGKHPDSAFYDSDRRLGFVPCGDGTLTVISFESDRPRVAEVVATKAGARTGALDPVTGWVYLPTAELGPPATAGGRPSVVPDTLEVLVVGGH